MSKLGIISGKWDLVPKSESYVNPLAFDAGLLA